MVSRYGVLVVVLLLAGTAARADIYEWRDTSGARHFTNSKDGVPSEYQASAHVLIADWAHPVVAAAPAAPQPAPAVADRPPAEAQVVTDTGGWSDGYEAGVRAAIELGGGGGSGGTSSVQINGPLAVSSVRASDSVGYPGFYPPWPWYYPFVTTGFDRGRSRHQTLRMLLQDQFQLDRDGPFAYQRWDQPGLGPALAPFLSRGLPNGISQYGRVIYR